MCQDPHAANDSPLPVPFIAFLILARPSVRVLSVMEVVFGGFVEGYCNCIDFLFYLVWNHILFFTLLILTLIILF